MDKILDFNDAYFRKHGISPPPLGEGSQITPAQSKALAKQLNKSRSLAIVYNKIRKPRKKRSK